MQVLDTKKRSAAIEDLEARLSSRVVGQHRAISEVVRAIQVQAIGMEQPGKPLSSFLFLGPTGVGKTRVTEALAEVLHGNPEFVLKIDCGEFQHSHEIAKLIGSPPGYLGHRETHPLLSQEALQSVMSPSNHVAVVLFDEVEKASDALWNLLLGVLDKAILTLGDNRRVRFERAMIFMTANVGATELAKLAGPGFGFAEHAAGPEKGTQVAEAAARKKFTPEFMNRLDKVVVFHALEPEHLQQILVLELGQVQRRVIEAAQRPGSTTPAIVLECTPGMQEFLLAEGTDRRYGARHLKRAIETHLVQDLSNLISSGQLRQGDIVSVDRQGGETIFSKGRMISAGAK